jgi:ribosomal protein L11 methyltransferase
MKHALFTVNVSSSLENALEELLSLGLEHPYFIEEPKSPDKIGGFFFSLLPSVLEHSILSEQGDETIDWDKEWKTHSPYYKDGLLEIDLNAFDAHLQDSKIYLHPGPGFGDLSHPTTSLMLSTMIPYIQGKKVIDIGCGSGILSLAALKLGAKKVIGLDIDEEALKHSQNNALLNHFLSFELSKYLNINELDENPVFLINMTFEEQKAVFKAYPELSGTFIISGILKSQKHKYLDEFPYSSTPKASFEQGEWISMVLSN